MFLLLRNIWTRIPLLEGECVAQVISRWQIKRRSGFSNFYEIWTVIVLCFFISENDFSFAIFLKAKKFRKSSEILQRDGDKWPPPPSFPPSYPPPIFLLWDCSLGNSLGGKNSHE